MAPRSSSTQRRVFVDRQSSHRDKLAVKAWKTYTFYCFIGALTVGQAYLAGLMDGYDQAKASEEEVRETKEDGDTDSTDK